MITTPVRPLTVTPSQDGQPTIHWDLDLATADQLLAILGGSRINLNDADFAGRVLDPLYLAVSEAMDVSTRKVGGCPELWPDAAPVALTDPAVLGNDTGDMLAVLIPGTPDYVDAITTAVNVAREAGADLDPTDPDWIAEVQQPRWLLLNSCESPIHDFHPELAAHGPRTPGAVLVTRVDLIHEPGPAHRTR